MIESVKMSEFSVQSKSQLAKLLATENLTIEHQKIRTAKFDPKNRVLYCPIWQNMSGDLYDLLMGHEVGHALETPAEGWHDAVTVNNRGKNYKHFLNVVEDARIEKKVKRRYPGLRASFVRGYKSLLDRDFFGLKNRFVNNLPFIDRLNMYTKCGAQLGIVFSDEEQKMVDQVEACETWEDVIRVTDSVFEYSKNEQFEIQQETFNSFSYDDSEDDEYNDDYEFDDYDSDSDEESMESQTSESDEESDEDGDSEEDSQNVGERRDVEEKSESAKESKEEIEEGDKTEQEKPDNTSKKLNRYKDSVESQKDQFEPTCQTDESFRANEDSLLDASCKEFVYVNLPTPNLEQIITPYKRVHEQIEVKMAEYPNVDANKLYTNFKNKNDRYIGLLAKEFEMRKAAKAYAKTKASNTGDIDISRLWKYQVDDNIFRKIQRTPKGKSHGLVLLLDRSGSMTDNMAGSLEQIMVLVSFCRKVNIPFVVYGFGDCDDSRRLDFPNKQYEKNFSQELGEVGFSNVYLREYINSRMGNAEFTRCMKNLSYLKKSYESRYSRYLRPDSEHLSNTPLIQAMVAMKPIVNDFRKINNLDLVNLAVIHDGDADSNNRRIVNGADMYGREVNVYRGFDNHMQNVIVRDGKNKVEVQLKSESRNGHYDDALRVAVFEWFHKVTGVKIFGFFISGEAARSVRSQLTCKYVYEDGSTVNDKLGIPKTARYWQFSPAKSDLVKDLAKTLQKDKFLQSYNDGYNSFFMIPGGSDLRIENDELSVDGKVTATKLKTAFMKVAKAKQVNRVLVSKFIQGIAS